MIVVVINDYVRIHGGSDQVAITGALSTSAMGIQTHYVYVVDEEIPSNLIKSEVTLHCLGGCDSLGDPNRLRSAFFSIWNPIVFFRLLRILGKFSKEETIVHVHGWTKALTPAVYSAARYLQLRVVTTLHDYFSVCPNGALFNFKSHCVCPLVPLSAKCCFTNCDRRSYSHKIWRLIRFCAQWSIFRFPRNGENLIFISQYSKKIITPLLKGRRIHEFDVGNSVDVRRQLRVDVSANENFVYIGRLTIEKAPHHLAQAAVRLGIKVVFIGSGELSELIKKIYPSAEVTGWIDREGILKCLQKARVVVFTSIWHENQPLVPMEAQALGIPVIVADRCAATESVVDGATGLYYKSGDIEDLCVKIRLLFEDGAVESMGATSYDKFWASHNGGEYAARLLRTYSTILLGN